MHLYSENAGVGARHKERKKQGEKQGENQPPPFRNTIGPICNFKII